MSQERKPLRPWIAPVSIAVPVLYVAVLAASAAAVSCYFFTEPNGSYAENSHSSPRFVEPVANEARPTDPDGNEIKTDGNAPKETLIGFTIDEQGFATDEQVEAQMKILSSEFSGRNQNDAWSVWVGLDLAATLKTLGLEEAQLNEPSSGFGGRINWKSWRISPSYRLQLTYDFALRENTLISFPKVDPHRSP